MTPVAGGVFAQTIGPQQDCSDAIPVCGTQFEQDSSYQGIGAIDEVNTNVSCLENGENNSVWYVFTVTQSGRLQFSIVPKAQDDYDFALYRITGFSCADIFDGGLEVRCSYAFTLGPTGLSDPYTGTSSPPQDTAKFLAPLDVLEGETYVLLVDNFNTSLDGYTLDFNPNGTSTARIVDTELPFISNVDSMECATTETLNVTFSEPIRCASLGTNGTDFLISGPGPAVIDEVFSQDCILGAKFTLNATITLSNPILVGGTYNLQLRQGADGNTVEDNCENNANPATHAFFVPEVVIANFDYTTITSCDEDTFFFENISVTSAGTTTVLWDFGDNTATSALDNPVHVYTTVGTYTVTLIVTTPTCSDTLSRDVIVTNEFNAFFVHDPQEPCANQPVQFIDSSHTASTSFLWRGFPEGSSSPSHLSNDQNPTFTFISGGLYHFFFSIYGTGCGDTVEMDVFVHDNVEAAFETEAPTCTDQPVNFTDISAGSPASWTWTFDDGTIESGSNTSHIYPDVGTFPVQFAVVDSFCGTDTTTGTVTILPSPFFYLGDDTLLCRSEEVTLTAASAGADSYLWSTGETTATILYDEVPSEVWVTASLGGCDYSDTLRVFERTADCSFALVPSGFSPNADSKNDILRVLTKRVTSYELIVFNRWGQEVYRGTNSDYGWDGSFKDEPQDIGVFSYVLNWTNLSGQKFVNKGSVTLVR